MVSCECLFGNVLHHVDGSADRHCNRYGLEDCGSFADWLFDGFLECHVFLMQGSSVCLQYGDGFVCYRDCLGKGVEPCHGDGNKDDRYEGRDAKYIKTDCLQCNIHSCSPHLSYPDLALLQSGQLQVFLYSAIMIVT